MSNLRNWAFRFNSDFDLAIANPESINPFL